MRERAAGLKVFDADQLSCNSIDSFSLTHYLLDTGLLPETAYPSHIDLSLYKPHIHNLYGNAKTVHVLDERLRNDYTRVVEENMKNNPVIAKIIREYPIIKGSFLEKVNKQALGERSMYLFRDPDTGDIQSSDIAFGEYTSVSSEAPFQLKDEGKEPFLGLHTHPDDVLFSPGDYETLITAYENRTPLIRSKLVLCPNLQVLALVTNQTPVLPASKASRFVEKWKTKAEGGDDEGIPLLMEELRIQKKFDDTIERELKVQLGNYKKTAQSERVKRRDRRETGRSEKKSKERLDRARAQYEEEIRKVDNLISVFSNAKLLELARLLNIVLYVSTNSRDFYKFSA